jgi:hypothetical protein
MFQDRSSPVSMEGTTMKNRWSIIGLVILVVSLVLAAGCNGEPLRVGELQTKSTTVELGAAETVSAEIKMGAGRLAIDGGGDELLQAQFTYNVEGWQPEVDYEVTDGLGRLQVDQPATNEGFSLDLDDIRYEWDLRFNEDVPMDMAITLGAGDSQLALSNLSLNTLDFENGAGDTDINLSGSTVRDLEVRMGAGNVSVDLSGNWQQDLSADMIGGIGRATVILPTSAGVRVRVQGGLGQVNATGLIRDGNVYTNDAYGASDVTLDIDIEGGVGEINLELAE